MEKILRNAVGLTDSDRSHIASAVKAVSRCDALFEAARDAASSDDTRPKIIDLVFEKGKHKLSEFTAVMVVVLVCGIAKAVDERLSNESPFEIVHPIALQLCRRWRAQFRNCQAIALVRRRVVAEMIHRRRTGASNDPFAILNEFLKLLHDKVMTVERNWRIACILVMQPRWFDANSFSWSAHLTQIDEILRLVTDCTGTCVDKAQDLQRVGFEKIEQLCSLSRELGSVDKICDRVLTVFGDAGVPFNGTHRSCCCDLVEAPLAKFIEKAFRLY